MKKQLVSYLWLILGSFLLVFMGWRWNAPFAVWLAPVFLMRFFRQQGRWAATLPAIPLMTLALFANITGSWDFSLAAEIGIGLIRATPFLLALTLDRALARRMRPGLATLVYPVAYVAADYLLGLSPLGTTFSAAATQFEAKTFLQFAAVAGIWGLDFVMGWAAAVVNLAWERGFDLKAAGSVVAVFAVSLSLILAAGGFRLAHAPDAPTVRVAGVTVPHPRDYWGAVIDLGTPPAEAQRYAAEAADLEDALFAASERAVEAGAKIVFWSEGNAVLYPETVDAFFARAQDFAKTHQVYLAPAYIIFQYGEATSDNAMALITPAGEIAYTYTKTKTWYPTDSDGVIHSADTPYGRIGGAICFDADFPSFIHQAGKQGVDIMLVPAFDWKPIKPYHTQVGLFRALENGMSIVRQVNTGTSMAVDYQGRLLAYQDYFTTEDRTMLADVPTRGIKTGYAVLGDGFAYLSIALTIFFLIVALRRQFAGGAQSGASKS
ncbi:MAG TPA: nitrilase-related carbon-nitrogen hydrolase [Anaerolineae bacterium]|nr:nitrilase-related carbon-nitrogen hydrolase [Anaerolineae bacterium]